MSHTPGPWRVMPESQAQSPWIVGDAEGGSIADCEPCGPWMPDEVADANARLIASAPDLLAALRGYLDARPQCECTPHSGCQMAKARSAARAAIAKAEGPTP